eukprot:257937-Chlamydomonas_euryale.AAC.5
MHACLCWMQTVLEEVFDPNYVPTQVEIREYAEWLGLDQEKEAVRLCVCADVHMYGLWLACEELAPHRQNACVHACRNCCGLPRRDLGHRCPIIGSPGELQNVDAGMLCELHCRCCGESWRSQRFIVQRCCICA